MLRHCKRLLFLLVIFLSLSIFVTAYSQIPQLLDGWPFKTHSGFTAGYCTPAITNDSIINNGMAIFFADNLSKVYKFQTDCSLFSGWPFISADTAQFNELRPFVFDVDHDGMNETLILGFINVNTNPWDFRYCSLLLLDHNGTTMNGFPWLYTARIGGINVADFDDDGEYEIMACVPDSRLLFCFNRFGQIIDGWPIELADDVEEALPRSYCVGDLDLNGTNEFIMAGHNHIYAYNHDGSMQPGFPISLPDTSYYYCYSGAQPALADIDHDGYLEIITSSSQWHPGMIFNSEVYIYEHTGEMKSPWPLVLPDKYVFQSPIPADIDGDGELEIGFQADTLYYFIDINKNSKPGWPRTYYRSNGQIRGSYSEWIIVDLNGDRHCEIFTDHNVLYNDSTGHHSWLYGIDYQGNELPGYPIRVNGEYLGLPPQFGYDHNSHRLYMAIATEMLWIGLMDTVSLELFLYPDSTGPADQWPMLSHDLLMTRNYNFVDNVSSGIADGRPDIPKSFCLRQNYPNPFNSSTTISYDLPEQSNVNIKIYNILGQAITTLVDEIQPVGRHSIIWNAEGCPSGIYYCRIEASRYSVARKMMLIK